MKSNTQTQPFRFNIGTAQGTRTGCRYALNDIQLLDTLREQYPEAIFISAKPC